MPPAHNHTGLAQAGKPPGDMLKDHSQLGQKDYNQTGKTGRHYLMRPGSSGSIGLRQTVPLCAFQPLHLHAPLRFFAVPRATRHRQHLFAQCAARRTLLRI